MEDRFRRQLGRRIAAARNEINLSIASFAAELGVSRRHYKRIEAGKAYPAPSTLVIISNLTGCSLNFLLKGGEAL